MFVLGIDPGVSRCGFAVVEATPNGPKARAIGVLRTDPNDELPYRLAELHFEIKGLLDEFNPDVVAIERVLFQVNVRTAMSVGQASGLVLAEGAARGAVVVEYSPNEVKLTVAGYGNADKGQVQVMVQRLLGLAAAPEPADAADAAAVALAHLARTKMERRVNRADKAAKSARQSQASTTQPSKAQPSTAQPSTSPAAAPSSSSPLQADQVLVEKKPS